MQNSLSDATDWPALIERMQHGSPSG
jgi:hypothetical protein